MRRDLPTAAAEAAGCTRCRLSEGRTQVVYGAGRPDADLLFVGEGPGFHEDRQGVPFVGAAGQLLDRMLAGVGIDRRDVYIANVVKCRPPGNRDPQPDEIAACAPWLAEQVALIDPRVVVTLGNFATRFVLDRPVAITRVRGQRFEIGGRIVIPTFHPAAILRGGGEGSRQFAEFRGDFEEAARALAGVGAAVAGAPAPATAPAPVRSIPPTTSPTTTPADQPSLF